MLVSLAAMEVVRRRVNASEPHGAARALLLINGLLIVAVATLFSIRAAMVTVGAVLLPVLLLNSPTLRGGHSYAAGARRQARDRIVAGGTRFDIGHNRR
ncbi:MAG: hypothetical protein ACR2PL_11545 [Dehalococcoidia bacterium]